MEHPPKQGLKQAVVTAGINAIMCFNGTSTKTRIETDVTATGAQTVAWVLMEHPPKQGLKQQIRVEYATCEKSFNGTSTKTRIETGIRCLKSIGAKMF